jgi:hypothetical protein
VVLSLGRRTNSVAQGCINPDRDIYAIPSRPSPNNQFRQGQSLCLKHYRVFDVNKLYSVKDQKARLVLIYFPNFTTIYTFTLEDLWPKYTRIYYCVQHQICFYITPRQWKPGGWSWTREMGDQVDAHDGAERPLAAARPGAV